MGLEDQAASSALGGQDRGVPLRNEGCSQTRTESEEAEENSRLVLKEIEGLLMEGLNKDKELKHPKSVKEASSIKERTNVTRTQTAVEDFPKEKEEEGQPSAPKKDGGRQLAPKMGHDKEKRTRVQEPTGPACIPEKGRGTSPEYLEKK